MSLEARRHRSSVGLRLAAWFPFPDNRPGSYT
jgi:hypothetical protein